MKNALYIIGGLALAGGAYWLYKNVSVEKEPEAIKVSGRPNTSKVAVSKDLAKNMATAKSAVLINKAPQMLVQPTSSASAVEQYGAPVVPVDSPVFITNRLYLDGRDRMVNERNA